MAAKADTAFNPRAEVLASSRQRSGSIKMEGIEGGGLNPAPPEGESKGSTSSSMPSQFHHLRTRFEEKDGAGNRSGGSLFGSSVRQMKQRFQGGDSAQGGDVSVPPPYATGTNDSSPESKRKRVSVSASEGAQSGVLAPALNPKRRTSSMDSAPQMQHHHPIYVSPPLSPTHNLSSSTHSSETAAVQPSLVHNPEPPSTQRSADPTVPQLAARVASVPPPEQAVSEPTNHVQRFNYTKAFFARMEEETRLAQEREKVMKRKGSPSRLSIASSSHTSSPLLSPTATSPVPDAKQQHSLPPHSTDSLQRARRAKSIPQETPAGETVKSGRPVSDSINLSAEPPPTTHVVEEASSRLGSFPNNNAGRVAATEQPDHKKGEVKRLLGNIQGKSSAESVPKPPSHDTAHHLPTTEDLTVDTDLQPASVLPHSSRLEHSSRPALRSHQSKAAATRPPAAQGLSSSAPCSTAASPHSKTNAEVINCSEVSTSSLQSKSTPSLPSLTSETDPPSVVARRLRKSQENKDETAQKRLSREEIESALEKADTYLKNLESVPDSPPVKKESASSAARRRYLYGDTAASCAASSSVSATSPSSSVPSKRREQKDQPQAGDVQAVQSPTTSSAARSVAEANQGTTSSTSSLDQLNAILSGSLSGDSGVNETTSRDEIVSSSRAEFTHNTPAPPVYHNEPPPPYDVATSTSSMLISQKVLLNQQQQHEEESDHKPTPVPRRAAPPIPSRPASGKVAPPPPPPPAPSPGANEEPSMRGSRYHGNRNSRHGIILDRDTADDLILPEEHIAHHNQDGIQNGEVPRNGLLSPRESGDGKEDVDGGEFSDSEPLEIDYDNLSFLEIAPISSGEDEEDSSEDETIYHKPSRVCFSKNPIKVYATFSTSDYDRRNEDVDPVAASAEYELEKRVEKMDVFPVDLQKGSEGLGLSIIGMGVGADAGLEKLGIFVKTLTPNGAAQSSQQIQVNDQIIEVDGKSLVGVTQSYAASVLRNTSGHVKFLIGREKDPSKSEVARLIQQSLAQDRRREEMREKEQQRLKQEQDRLKELEDSFQPKDEVLERHAHMHEMDRQEEEDTDPSSDAGDESGDGSDQRDGRVGSYDLVEEGSGAGDTTPQSPPLSPSHSTSEAAGKGEEETTQDVSEPMEGDESSGSLSPDNSEKLYVKVKEGQYKLAVAEAEVAKLKARIIVLDEAEGQKKVLEKKVDDLNKKFAERDQHFDALKRELAQYKDMMVASQSQHIELERKVRELGALEKKYHKAKKLIKDYQQREKDFIQERESLLEQQNEKDQQYNTLVKSLKDRIFNLEKDLKDVQKSAGLPETVPASQETELTAITVPTHQHTPLVKATLNGLDESMSPLNQSTEDVLETSTCSEVSAPAASPDSEGHVAVIDRDATASPSLSSVTSDKQSRIDFDSVVNSSPLLDSRASRDKGHLAMSGSYSNRRPPSQKGKASDLFEDPTDSGSVQSEPTENGSCHSNSERTDVMPGETTDPGGDDSGDEETGVDMWDKHDRDDDSVSNSSSSVSQTSYDPNRVDGKWGNSEIPDSIAADDGSTNGEGGVTLVSAKASSSAKGFSFPKFNWKPSFSPKSGKSDGGGGGIVLLSTKTLGGGGSNPDSDSGGITLVSRRVLDTGYNDMDATSMGSDTVSSMMVSEPDDDHTGTFTLNISGNATSSSGQDERSSPAPSTSVTEWSPADVSNWLATFDLSKYSHTFTEKGINGSALLQLDSSRLKALGVTASKDRELLKKKIKEMKVVAEREKKQQEKERKQREKEQKKMFGRKK